MDDVAGAIERAITGNDLDALTRLVDELAGRGEWDALDRLRVRARQAFDRGYQLWPAAASAAYRLALHGPGALAAAVLDDDLGRFALGPLAEVAASTHSYDELELHLAATVGAAMFAHERVVRGDDLRHAEVARADVLTVPLALTAWEPAYPTATYHVDRVDAPAPEPPAYSPRPANGHDGVRLADDHAVVALAAVVAHWRDASNGSVRAVAVEGGLDDALHALGVRDPLACAVDAPLALARLAWAGASGGAHARRRGAAAGRDAAWFAASAIAGFAAGEPVDPHELGAAFDELRWWEWQAPDAAGGAGWVLRLAVEDRVDGVAFAIDATDRE